MFLITHYFTSPQFSSQMQESYHKLPKREKCQDWTGLTMKVGMQRMGGSRKLLRMAVLQRRSVQRMWFLSEYLNK